MLRKIIGIGSRGFSLIEVVIALAIVSILLISSYDMTSLAAKSNKNAVTQTNLAYIRSALVRYYTTNGRLPCPSLIDSAPTDTFYNTEFISFTGSLGAANGTVPTGQPYMNSCGGSIGRSTAAAFNGSGTTNPTSLWLSNAVYSATFATGSNTIMNYYTTRTDTGTSPGTSHNLTDFRGVAYGAVPTVTLGIDAKYMFDGYGNKIQYAVPARFTPNIINNGTAGIQNLGFGSYTFLFNRVSDWHGGGNSGYTGTVNNIGTYYGLPAGTPVIQVNYSYARVDRPPVYNDFITVSDHNTGAAVTNMAAFVLISLGADGFGAYNAQGSSYVSGFRTAAQFAGNGVVTQTALSLPTGKSTDTLNNIFYQTNTTINAGSNNAIVPYEVDTTYRNGLFFMNSVGNYSQVFDDIVTYATINDIANDAPNLVRCQGGQMRLVSTGAYTGPSPCGAGASYLCYTMGCGNGSCPGATSGGLVNMQKVRANLGLRTCTPITGTAAASANMTCGEGGVWNPPVWNCTN